MAKDPLLNEKFFSLERSASEIILDKEELTELTQLIKKKLYPHLSTEQAPTYYKGAYNFADLTSFIYPLGSQTQSDQFKTLQAELKLTVAKLQSWVEHNEIAGFDTLHTFLLKLTQPTDSVAIMYADGKNLLEKVTLLLDEPEISLNNRKNVANNLLADRELEKCINGCYSRIASAALQLQENLQSKNQIKVWLRTFFKDMARNVAAQRPFALPESYQAVLCRASDCAADQNMLHASNYLFMQAKEHGLPLDSVRDPGAIELGRGLTLLSKTIILKLYTDALDRAITAKNLVYYMSGKLHDDFQLIMSRDIDYVDKTELILDKLNLLGEDLWFKTGKVGLGEIISEEGQLKAVDALKITVTERLIQRGLLKSEKFENIILTGGNFHYRGFASAIELTWFWMDEERKPLLQLIKEDRVPLLIR